MIKTRYSAIIGVGLATLLFIAPRLEAQPSNKQVGNALTSSLPIYVEVVSFEVKARENMGRKLGPAVIPEMQKHLPAIEQWLASKAYERYSRGDSDGKPELIKRLLTNEVINRNNAQAPVANALIRKINFIESLSLQQDLAARILDEASRWLPEKTRLIELEYSGQSILFKGTTQDQAAIARYISNIEESRILNNAKLVSSNQNPTDNAEFEFQFRASVKNEESEEQYKRQGIDRITDNTGQARPDIETLTAQLRQIESAIPQRREIPDMLRQIQALAHDSRLDVLRFAPGTEINKEFYAEWPIPIQVSGNYHNLGLFLNRLSKFPRVFTVQNFAIKPLASQTNLNSISASCTLTTYFFTDGATVPQPQLTQKRSESSSVQAEQVRANKPRTPFIYNPLGRKDPFIDSQVGPNNQNNEAGDLSQISIKDSVLFGIVKNKDGFTAMVGLPQGFPRIAKVGDKLKDGYVLSISENQVVFRQTHDGNELLMRPRDIIKDIIMPLARNVSQ